MLFQVTMFPSGRGKTSASAEVAKVINIIDKSGLPYKLTAMSTIIEGNWDEVMAVINKARQTLRRSNDRIHISITVDDRKGVRKSLSRKIESIEKRLNREVSK